MNISKNGTSIFIIFPFHHGKSMFFKKLFILNENTLCTFLFPKYLWFIDPSQGKLLKSGGKNWTACAKKLNPSS